jgi:hypothetical protein
MSSNYGGIYRVVGRNLKFLEFFQIFWSPNGQTWLVFSLNGRIRIQMVKFQFKRTNHESSRYYRPSAPLVGGSAGCTTEGYRPARAGASTTVQSHCHVLDGGR